MCCTAVAKSDKTEKTAKVDKNKNVTLYMYGVSISFSDSISYITDIQEVEGAFLYGKGFLGSANSYSAQMDSYFNEKTGDNRTNAVFFAGTRKDAEKAYLKLKRKYAKKGMHLDPLPVADFKFSAIRSEE